MKLIGPAKKYWRGIEQSLENMNEPPIRQWTVMKRKLTEKYLPTFHKRQLYDQLLNLKQTSTVSSYMEGFDELMLRVGINEVKFQIVGRFVNRLRGDYQE